MARTSLEILPDGLKKEKEKKKTMRRCRDGGDYTRHTFALEVVSRGGEEQLVPEGEGLRAAGNARLHVVTLDPFGQPAKVAITIEWIGSQGTAKAQETDRKTNKQNKQGSQQRLSSISFSLELHTIKKKR